MNKTQNSIKADDKAINLKNTIKGTLLENFYPCGWDFDKIEACIGTQQTVFERQQHWNDSFNLVMCDSLNAFEVKMGHEIALQIKKSFDENYKLALILPAGPMGMYAWTTFFLNEWNVDCKNLYTFNMDEYADSDGNTLDGDNIASFEYAMTNQFFNRLKNPNPISQRNFATSKNLCTYEKKMSDIKRDGGKQVLVYGIGRMCHIAFWEPQYAEEFENEEQWLNQAYRIGAKLHPLTVEQNALTSFKSRSTLVPASANTIGPKLLFSSDYAIGGCDGVFSRGMQWQGLSFWMTLRYGKTPWVPSSYIPTLCGKLFFVKELATQLTPECN